MKKLELFKGENPTCNPCLAQRKRERNGQGKNGGGGGRLEKEGLVAGEATARQLMGKERACCGGGRSGRRDWNNGKSRVGGWY